ncbi:MAG: hypothetical protein ACI8PZ_002974 [Myxococcota bacterium]|jgi:hypothetical protein
MSLRHILAAAVLIAPGIALAGGPVLSIGGACPGVIDVEAMGFTPGGSVAVLKGSGPGSDIMPGGPCAGMASGLSGLGYVTTIRADGAGAVRVSPSVGGPLCGANIQFLDASTCTLSNLAVVGGGDIADNPECSDYGVLSDGLRHVDATGEAFCDSSLIALNNWYRLEGAAGTMMPEYAPGELQCSTHAPGWLDGAHPRGMGESAEIHTCWQWSGDICLWESETTVTNCGPFMVYFMRDLPFGCNGVFCGE